MKYEMGTYVFVYQSLLRLPGTIVDYEPETKLYIVSVKGKLLRVREDLLSKRKIMEPPKYELGDFVIFGKEGEEEEGQILDFICRKK